MANGALGESRKAAGAPGFCGLLCARRSATTHGSPSWQARSALSLLVDNRGQLLGAGQLGVRLGGKFAFDVIKEKPAGVNRRA